MATYPAIDITNQFDTFELSSGNSTFSSIDISDQFDIFALCSGNSTFSSIDISNQFDSFGLSSANLPFVSIDLTSQFDTFYLSEESPQNVKLFPIFEVLPVVDPAAIIFYEGDSEPALPEASFSTSAIAGPAPFSVNFTNTSTGTITERHWDFGDGGSSTSNNPTHIFSAVGTYTVYLRIFGGPYYSQTSAVIYALNPVIVDFISDVTTGIVPLTVNFTDTSVGGVISWLWTFGDGFTSTAQNPTHTYALTGTYTVSLTVGDGFLTYPITKPNYITVTPNLSANFSASPVAGLTPLLVFFQDISSGNPTSWLWEFGDGHTSTAQNPAHTYIVDRTYDVSLTVHRGAGSSKLTRLAYITVSKSIMAHFTCDVREGRIPLIVNFTDTSSGPVTGWHWNFGDGTYSTEQNPQHIYYRAGFYTVCLRVTDGVLYDTWVEYQLIHVISDNVVAVTVDASVPDDLIEVRTMLAREPTNFIVLGVGIKIFELTGQDDSLPGGFSRPRGPSILFD